MNLEQGSPDFEPGLSSADRLLAEEQIAELSELEEEGEPETVNRRVILAQKFRDLAPGAWALSRFFNRTSPEKCYSTFTDSIDWTEALLSSVT